LKQDKIILYFYTIEQNKIDTRKFISIFSDLIQIYTNFWTYKDLNILRKIEKLSTGHRAKFSGGPAAQDWMLRRLHGGEGGSSGKAMVGCEG
jgi:hypothetical protein